MMLSAPHDLDRKRVRELLLVARPFRDMDSRIDGISRQCVGLPYRDCPLDGGPDQKEVLTASVDGFDCVTFVESVLALASSDSVDEFANTLRLIRYRDGEVGWTTRNHYMTDWIRENQRAGFVRNLTRGRGVVRRERHLNVVPGLPEHRVQVSSLPKTEFMDRLRLVRSGDLAFFVSTRKNLDVYHCGVLIRGGEDVFMRHAARSRGHVVEEPVVDFLGRNRMVGVILIRPEEAFSRAA